MNIEYEKCGDYLIPNLTANREPSEPLTKYGLLRRSYLKEHRRGIYSGMMLEGTLKSHCLMVQEQAVQRLDTIMSRLAESEGVDERLKASDQMAWVRKMNNIKARAEEIIMQELICTP